MINAAQSVVNVLILVWQMQTIIKVLISRQNSLCEELGLGQKISPFEVLFDRLTIELGN